MAGWTLNPLSAQGSEAGGAAADLECGGQCGCFSLPGSCLQWFRSVGLGFSSAKWSSATSPGLRGR